MKTQLHKYICNISYDAVMLARWDSNETGTARPRNETTCLFTVPLPDENHKPRYHHHAQAGARVRRTGSGRGHT